MRRAGGAMKKQRMLRRAQHERKFLSDSILSPFVLSRSKDSEEFFDIPPVTTSRSFRLDANKLKRSRVQSVEARGVAAQYRLFVGVGQIFALEQAGDFLSTLLRVENFVRKIAAKDKRLASRFQHRETQTVVVDVEADKYPSFADLPAQIVARLLAFLRTADRPIVKIDLQVARMIGTIEPVEKKRHPGRAALEKRNAQLGKFFEDPVRQQAGGLDGDTEGMSQGVNRIIGA